LRQYSRRRSGHADGDWPVSPADIDYLFLTHAHIDHIGRVPELIWKGFKGEILCTHATKVLMHYMLEDALRFSDLPEKHHAPICPDSR
jgi:metallo-beta-lactamase family protein